MDSLFEAFKIRAEAVSAEVHRFACKAEALGFIQDFLQREGVDDAPECYAVWADDAFLSGADREQLRARIPGLTFEVTREKAAASRVGISQMEWAISQTGTLVQNAAPVARRLVSTLPLIHIALAPTAGIQADMPAVLKRIHPRDSGYISMITGPSRTADIERVLTIGVHGPERLVIVFVDEWGSN